MPIHFTNNIQDKMYRVVVIILIFLLSVANKSYSQQCDIIYVTPNGATTGIAGTKTNPADINYAIQLLTPTIRKIYLAQGNYLLSSVFPLNTNNVTFEGGFDPSLGWAKSNQFPTQILRDTNNVLPNPNRIIGVQAINIDNFVIQDVTIIVQNAKPLGKSVSVYGVYVDNCSNYKITRCKIRAGNAGNGSPGQNGTKGADGGDGLIGGPGNEDGNGNRTGGAGGNSWSNGAAAGGKGGDGGKQGEVGFYPFQSVCAFPWICRTAYNGATGTTGSGTNSPGVGGNGGQKYETFGQVDGCVNQPGNNMSGLVGSNGSDGIGETENPALFNGPNGVAAHLNGFFQPGKGGNGTKANAGSGGGGGGGGGSAAIAAGSSGGISFQKESTGCGGGGGGEGGEGGNPGTGGDGGGGSFGLYINNSGVNGFLKDSYFESGLPGLGASGGFGGFGGFGGYGGPGGGTGYGGQGLSCTMGAGGMGGRGGNGGKGGNGGNGAKGESFGLYISPNTPFGNVDSLILAKPTEPIVTAVYNGCSETDVTFSVQALGAITWFFGSGSNPVSATGSIAKVRYNSLGRKTITVIVNGESFTFSDFIDIRDSGAGLTPQISSLQDTVCAGATPTFVSSIVNSERFLWTFNGLFPDVDSPTINQISGNTYANAGDYIITLQTYTSCCGFSDIDTFKLHVRPNPAPTVNVIVQEGTNQICTNECLTFVATAANAEQNPVFTWYKNNTPVVPAVNSPVYNACGLQNNDVVFCEVTVNNECLSNVKIQSNTQQISAFTLPSIVPTANGNCFNASAIGNKFAPGELIKFNASATGGSGGYTFIWEFGNNSGGVGDTTTTIYTSPGKYAISVKVYDSFGCQSIACEDSIEINYYVEADFVVDTLYGCAPFTVNFENKSQFAVTYNWNFGDGKPNSIDENPIHIYTTPGQYTVQLTAFGSFTNDTSIVQSQVVVFPKPIADFIGVPAFVTSNDDNVNFAGGSLDATSWLWDFGDNSSGALNSSTEKNPKHYYATEGEYTVKLVVENAYGCKDSITKTNYIQRLNLVSVDNVDRISNSYVVYPNPFNNKFEIRFVEPISDFLKLELYNITGKLIHVKSINGLQNATQTIEFDNLSELANGVYFLRISHNGIVNYQKIIRANR